MNKEVKKTSNRKGSRKYYKGKKNQNSKDQRVERSNDDKYALQAAGDVNNPAYYYENSTVLDQVMNFSFNQFGGVMNTMYDPDVPTPFQRNWANTMIASYLLNPSIPTTEAGRTDISGATTAALRNYLVLSGSNAKTTNYAPQDVLLLEMAISELISIISWFARAFGIAYMFNYRNRTYPETLLNAMGIDDVDFFANLAQYRVEYNRLLALASKIPFPAAVPAFAKSAEIYLNLYVDDNDSALAQTYLFSPRSTWIFNETYDTDGSGLETLDWYDGITTQTLSLYLQKFSTMINALLNSTSLNYIYSDILRLVQSGKITNLITFTPIAETFQVTPVYNEEVKSWIHNAVIMSDPLPAASQHVFATEVYTTVNDVKSDAGNNTVFYHPQFMYAHPFGEELLIDFDHDNVSIEDKVRATRLSQRWVAFENTGDGNWYTQFLALSDHYVCSIHWYNGLGNTRHTGHNIVSSNTHTAIQLARLNDMFTKFDWAPLLYFLDVSSATSTELMITGDVDYYTTLNYETLKRIYDYEVIHYWQIG